MQPKYNDLSDPSQGDWLDKQLHDLSDQYDLIPVYKVPALPSDP